MQKCRGQITDWFFSENKQKLRGQELKGHSPKTYLIYIHRKH